MSRPDGDASDLDPRAEDGPGDPDVEVTELRPGEFAVRVGRRTVTAIVPAGVGVPGLVEDDLVVELVRLLAERGAPVPDPLDVSSLFVADPGLLAALERRLEP